MKYLFLLSKDNIGLAKAELFSSYNSNFEAFDSMIIMHLDNKPNINHLAYTKAVYKLLFKTSNLKESFEDYDWQSVCKKDFALRMHAEHEDHDEAKFASYIWKKIKDPKVNLKNPKTLIEVFFHKKYFCCLLLEKNNVDFQIRKAHKRPFLHPSSLHPKLARACVNLANGKKIVDPFCGSGGILIEAALIGKKVEGYDIDEKMLEGCRKNLDFFGIKGCKLEKKDFFKINKSIDNIVTDLPYGKNTKDLSNDFFNNFFDHLGKILKARAVVMLPENEKININTLKKVFELKYYIHKSMTKRILVLEPDNIA